MPNTSSERLKRQALPQLLQLIRGLGKNIPFFTLMAKLIVSLSIKMSNYKTLTTLLFIRFLCLDTFSDHSQPTALKCIFIDSWFSPSVIRGSEAIASKVYLCNLWNLI